MFMHHSLRVNKFSNLRPLCNFITRDTYDFYSRFQPSSAAEIWFSSCFYFFLFCLIKFLTCYFSFSHDVSTLIVTICKVRSKIWISRHQLEAWLFFLSPAKFSNIIHLTSPVCHIKTCCDLYAPPSLQPIKWSEISSFRSCLLLHLSSGKL